MRFRPGQELDALQYTSMAAQGGQVTLYLTYSRCGMYWETATQQPSVAQSHWKLTPDGKAWAHTDTQGDDYTYEPLGGTHG